MISESIRLQAILNTYGIVTQTPDELEPVEVWSQAQMVKVYQLLGSSPALGLRGRPHRGAIQHTFRIKDGQNPPMLTTTSFTHVSKVKTVLGTSLVTSLKNCIPALQADRCAGQLQGVPVVRHHRAHLPAHLLLLRVLPLPRHGPPHGGHTRRAQVHQSEVSMHYCYCLCISGLSRFMIHAAYFAYSEVYNIFPTFDQIFTFTLHYTVACHQSNLLTFFSVFVFFVFFLKIVVRNQNIHSKAIHF